MSMLKFKELIPCPDNPVGVSKKEELIATQESLGVTFPPDFVDFIQSYGSGHLGEFYHVWNPFDSKKFLKTIDIVCWNERDSKRMYPEFFPYEIYPNSPGFLPWGSDDNGNYYGWLTKGAPEEWLVLTNEVRGNGYTLHSLDFSGYLLGIFNGSIRALAPEYPDDDCYSFRSY